MTWLLFVLGAVLSWGVYGVALHTGQVQLGNPLKALLCVGVAYFLIGVVVPIVALSSQGGLTGFSAAGTTWATGGATAATGMTGAGARGPSLFMSEAFGVTQPVLPSALRPHTLPSAFVAGAGCDGAW